MNNRKRRIRPTTRKARLRRTEIFRKLRRTHIRKTDREALLAELNQLSPYLPEPAAEVEQ